VTWKHYSLERAAASFDNSLDLTIGIEEEFQILDADTLELTNRFEDLSAVAHKKLGTFVKGELIASEIEISTAKCESIAAAEADLTQKRRLLAESASELGLKLGTTGTHPFSDWKKQRILDTHHYREVEERVRYCAWHNLTYGMHTHVGVRGRERMIAVFNSLRGYMPAILALSANSPFSEGRYTYLHSTRAQIFTRSFPRGNIPGPFRDWDDYATFIDTLFVTNSISEPTQVWWSLRPHPLFGTLEIRICDSQSDIRDTLAISALVVSLVARLSADFDEGRALVVLNTREVDENIWRAARYGLAGNLADFNKRKEIPVTDIIRALVEFTGDMQEKLGIESYVSRIAEILDEGNGAQKQIRLFEEKGDVAAVFSDLLDGSPII